jgi:serine protease SohB
MELFYDYLLFFAKSFTLVVAILTTLLCAVAIITKNKDELKTKSKLKITKLNDKYEDMARQLESKILSKKEYKSIVKKNKSKDHDPTKNKIFLLNFKGDIRASNVEELRDQVTATLQVATTKDEVVINIESPGGVVHGYGLAASQLARFRDKNIPLTACVDKVAASGGYLMATVANQILAAPFSIIGSIGVIAQLPNFNRLLKKNNIDFEEHTAGEYKRTLTYFGEITDQGRTKFKENLTEVHEIFKSHIAKYRSNVNLEEVANGDHWLGTTAHKMQLVDRIITSDDYLLSQCSKSDIYEINISSKKTFVQKLSNNIHLLAEHFNLRL